MLHNNNNVGWVKHLDFIILDVISVELAYFLAYLTRHGLAMRFPEILQSGAIVLVFVVILMSIFTENHKNILKRGLFQELKSATYLSLSSFSLLILYIVFMHEGSSVSRITMILWFPYSIIIMMTVRTLWKSYLKNRKVGTQEKNRVLLISDKKHARKIIENMKTRSYGTNDIIGLVLADSDNKVGRSVDGVEIVATLEDSVAYLQDKWCDGVLISVDDDIEIPYKIKEKYLLMGLTVKQTINISQESDFEKRIERNKGYLLMCESMRTFTAKQMFFKRFMDILGGLVGSIITVFLIIIFGPIIFFSDPGPIFFLQDRIGRNGRTFKMIKFRSMYKDAEARKKELMARNELDSNLMFKMENDPRIIGSGPDGTKHGVGWFIRTYSIDEFPQFFNVLIGQMSLVGTRPPTVDEWENYDIHHRARMYMKPGITGMWQVSGRSNITDFEEVVRMDTEYINKWSVALDIKILFKTFKAVLTKSGAK